jgi:NAD(P)-dependent dehydrogenase (short-subunit alcohol dehydrogenase family)
MWASDCSSFGFSWCVGCRLRHHVAGGGETVGGVEDAGGHAAFFRADVREDAEMRDLVSFAENTFGGLHVLINNASAPHGSDRLEEWANALETDLLGAIYATRWAIEVMRRGGGGAIVNIASISALWHGRKTPGGLPGYDVAKAGMIRMTTRLASLDRTDRIRVNCLAPGWIAVEGPRQYWASLTPSERAERGAPSRLLTTDEIAGAVERPAQRVRRHRRVAPRRTKPATNAGVGEPRPSGLVGGMERTSALDRGARSRSRSRCERAAGLIADTTDTP